MSEAIFYKLVQADTCEELQKKVNNCISAGFKPIGGVAVNSAYEEYTQALVSYKPE